jgi:hypothetical protein
LLDSEKEIYYTHVLKLHARYSDENAAEQSQKYLRTTFADFSSEDYKHLNFTRMGGRPKYSILANFNPFLASLTYVNFSSEPGEVQYKKKHEYKPITRVETYPNDLGKYVPIIPYASCNNLVSACAEFADNFLTVDDATLKADDSGTTTEREKINIFDKLYDNRNILGDADLYGMPTFVIQYVSTRPNSTDKEIHMYNYGYDFSHLTYSAIAGARFPTASINKYEESGLLRG